MKMLTDIIRFSAIDPAGDDSIVSVVTEYSDMKFPSLSMFFLSLSIVVLIGVSVAAFIFIKKNFKGWAYSLLAGFTAYLLFGYVVYMGAQLGLSYTPGFQEWAESHNIAYTILLTLVSVILEILGVFLGMLYVMRSAEKKGIRVNMGTPLAFGAAFYTAAYAASKQISYCFQYIMIGSSINSEGFDSVVSMLISAGTDEEGAIDALYTLVSQKPVDYLFDTMHYVLLGVASTIAAIIFYGCLKKCLEKKWSLLAIASLTAFGIPNIISTAFDLSVGFNLLLGIIVVFAMYVLMVRVVKKYMPEELTAVKDRKAAEEAARKEANKMPKIKMPD